MKHDKRESADLGKALTELRAKRGDPSFGSIERFLWQLIGPDVTPTDQTIANIHAGKTHPMVVTPEVLIGLALFYGVEVSVLGPAAQRRVEGLRGLLNSPPSPALIDRLRHSINRTEQPELPFSPDIVLRDRVTGRAIVTGFDVQRDAA